MNFIRLKSSNPIVVGVGFGILVGIAILIEPPASTTDYVQEEWRNVLYNFVIFFSVSFLFILFSLSTVADYTIPVQILKLSKQQQEEEETKKAVLFMSNREEDKNKVVVHIIGGTGLVGRALVRHLARYEMKKKKRNNKVIIIINNK